MKIIASLSVVGMVLLSNVSAAEPKDTGTKLECAVIEEHDKLIRCTFYATRLAEDRTITFQWRSETTPQDDRERTFVLPARHGSVYDYRYYYGRAQGLWNVTAVDEDGTTLAETSFILE